MKTKRTRKDRARTASLCMVGKEAGAIVRKRGAHSNVDQLGSDEPLRMAGAGLRNVGLALAPRVDYQISILKSHGLGVPDRHHHP
jgi:hypothetical protein